MTANTGSGSGEGAGEDTSGEDAGGGDAGDGDAGDGDAGGGDAGDGDAGDGDAGDGEGAGGGDAGGGEGSGGGDAGGGGEDKHLQFSRNVLLQSNTFTVDLTAYVTEMEALTDKLQADIEELKESTEPGDAPKLDGLSDDVEALKRLIAGFAECSRGHDDVNDANEAMLRAARGRLAARKKS